METQLQELYAVFSRYPLRAKVDGCPCCVTGAQQEALHSKHLQNLSSADLDRYVFKAMTTWGDDQDFRHFLPRILDLQSCGNPWYASLLIDKLQYGRWRTWPSDEQAAIAAFLMFYWRDLLGEGSSYNLLQWLPELLNAGLSHEELLAVWKPETDALHLQHAIHATEELIPEWLGQGKRDSYHKAMPLNGLEVVNWLRSHFPVMEQAFFDVSESDPALARRISRALQAADWALEFSPYR